MIHASSPCAGNTGTTASDMIDEDAAHTVSASKDGHGDRAYEKGDEKLGSASAT